MEYSGKNLTLKKQLKMKHFDDFVPPFRLGRKQKRAILDGLGHELIVFPEGLANQAREYCLYLNNKAETKKLFDDHNRR